MSKSNNKQTRIAIIDEMLSSGEKISFQDVAQRFEEVFHDAKGNKDNYGGKYYDLFRQDIKDIRIILTNARSGLSLDMLKSEGKGRQKRVYYYAEQGFSIMPYYGYRYSKYDYKRQEEALKILKADLPETVFETVEFSLRSRIEYDFGNNDEKSIDYGENLSLRGRHWLPIIYKVVNKKVVRIHYKTFKGEEFDFHFHPYLLKQYNNRWFLFGRHDEKDLDYWNVPVDRIFNIQEISNVDFHSRPKDYLNHFRDFIGVHDGRFDGDESGDQNDKVLEDSYFQNKQHEKEIIKLKIKTKGLWGRMKTKPLHESQSVCKDFDDDLNYGLLTIEVIPNVEFYNQLVSLGENVVVEGPQNVKDLVVQRLKNTLKNYENSIV